MDTLQPIEEIPVRAIEIDKPGSLREHMEEFAKLQRTTNELIKRANGGFVTKGELEELIEREEKFARQMVELQEKLKGDRYHSGELRDPGAHFWQPAKTDLERISRVLEVPDDFKGLDRTYYNVMVQNTEELLGMSAVGDRHLSGLGVFARDWTKHNPSAATNITRIKQLHDRILLKNALLETSSRAYRQRSHDPLQRMKTLREWTEYEQRWGETFGRAESTGMSNAPVPVIMSSRIGDLLEVFGRVPNLFARFPMTSKSFEWPFQSGHLTVYLPGEDTSDHGTYAAGITASSVTYSKPVWTAVKLAALTFTSTELDEDSIDPMIPWLENEMAKVITRADEDAIINGESGGVTMDGATFNPAGQAKRAWNGLRFHSLMTSSYGASTDAGGTITDGTMIGLLGKMNQWGIDPAGLAWICNFRGYAALRVLPTFLTAEKFPSPVNVVGSLGTAYGSPVIVSDLFPSVDTTGKVNATPANNIKGEILAVARDRYLIGDRRGIDVESSVHVAFRNDQVAVRGTQRLDFKPVDVPTGSTITPVGVIFNIN